MMSFRPSVIAIVIWNLVLFPDFGYTATASSGRAVSSNGGPNVATKSNVLPIRACPTALFTFQSPYWQTENTIFTPFIAGQDFCGSIRVCRYRSSDRGTNGNEFEPGFERSDWQWYRGSVIPPSPGGEVTEIPVTAPSTPLTCKDEVTVPVPGGEGEVGLCPGTGQLNNREYGACSDSPDLDYQVLYLPKSVSIDWVTPDFPRFPNLSPAPMSISVGSSRTIGYLARCRIVVESGYDPSVVIRIPGIIFPDSGQTELQVTHNGVNYKCDQENLEFAVCI